MTCDNGPGDDQQGGADAGEGADVVITIVVVGAVMSLELYVPLIPESKPLP